MSNLTVKPNPALSLPQTPVTPKPAEQPHGLKTPEKAASLQNDLVQWSNTSTSKRVGTAIKETFKSTAIPSAIGGALAPAVGGAMLGGFVGMFNGQVGNMAKEGFMAGLKYAPHGAAAGLAIAGADAVVVGSVVGSSPDKAAAMTRLGTATAIVGLLTAEDGWDVIDTGLNTAHNSVRAGRIFDKTNAALQGQ